MKHLLRTSRGSCDPGLHAIRRHRVHPSSPSFGLFVPLGRAHCLDLRHPNRSRPPRRPGALRPRRRKRPWRTPTASATARGERRARADAARGGHRWETGHLRAQESKRVVKMVGLGVLMWSSFQAAKVGEELCEIPVFKSGNQGIWMGLGTGPPAPQLFGERTS